MNLPVIIVHGWSDSSRSFKPLVAHLKQRGFNVVQIWLGDYISMHDDVTLEDIGLAFQRALKAENIPVRRHSFDLIVHSTGGLVAREFLRQICRKPDGTRDASLTPIRHLCMMAPANFGSPLAALGKSVLGRILKGWTWDVRHLGETGQRVLNALELASPYAWQLALDDLFDDRFPIFDPKNVLATVMVGSASYDGIREVMHEAGGDGTVRVSTANLNAHYFLVDFKDPEAPVITEDRHLEHAVAFAVFERNHTTIHSPKAKAQRAEWEEILHSALTVEPAGYTAHARKCADQTQATYTAHPNESNYHQYMHVVFRVRDQFGGAIKDYVIDFYDPDDRKDIAYKRIHGEIIEKVTTYSGDASFRSFMMDMTDLEAFLEEQPGREVDMSVAAADISDDVAFLNPSKNALGLDVFAHNSKQFVFRNEPVLVEVILHRSPDKKVFRLKRA